MTLAPPDGLVSDERVIEQLAANRSHEAFRGAILPGTLECRSLRMDSESRDRANNVFGERQATAR
jgi:hypothetical protein